MTTSIKITITSLIIATILVVTALLYGGFADAQSAPGNTAPGSTLQKRIAQRKAERNIKLNPDNKQRLEGTCINVQTKVRLLRDGYVTVSNNRNQTYRKVDARLWIVIGSLKYVDKDTFKLEQQRNSYLRKVKKFENTSEQFRQTLDDMSTMNCKADVVGFKALLDTARLYNTQIRKQSNDITNQVINEIKPTVSVHANSLKPNTSTE